jgi:transcriptional regulator with XRE-family HTH domain
LAAKLGARFQAARNRYGSKVTLTELSKKLGVSVNTLRWHEAGARMLRADQIHEAAGIMGIPPGELLTVLDEDVARGERFAMYRIKNGIKLEALCREIRATPQEIRWHEMGVAMLERDQLRRAAVCLKAPLAELAAPDSE